MSTLWPILHHDDAEQAVGFPTDVLGLRADVVARDDEGDVVHAELDVAGGGRLVVPPQRTRFGNGVETHACTVAAPDDDTAVGQVGLWARDLAHGRASQRAADRCGFRREGLLRSWQTIGRQRRDMYVYGRLHEPDPVPEEVLCEIPLAGRHVRVTRARFEDVPALVALLRDDALRCASRRTRG